MCIWSRMKDSIMQLRKPLLPFKRKASSLHSLLEETEEKRTLTKLPFQKMNVWFRYLHWRLPSLWFKRKSLICDLMEPFRCIIDRTIRSAYHRKQFSVTDFTLWKGEYRLKIEKNGDYCRVFFDALIPYKKDIFCYIQHYYRYFMQRKSISQFPFFQL